MSFFKKSWYPENLYKISNFENILLNNLESPRFLYDSLVYSQIPQVCLIIKIKEKEDRQYRETPVITSGIHFLQHQSLYWKFRITDIEFAEMPCKDVSFNYIWGRAYIVSATYFHGHFFLCLLFYRSLISLFII